MIIGYARVSSTGQNDAAQVELLRTKGAEKLFVEKASGSRRDGRPKLKEAIEWAREGDELIVTRLDRLARSVTDLHAIVSELRKKGVGVRVTEQEFNTTTSNGRLMFNVLASIAEFENDLRRERQAEGIAKAKAEGRYKGRPAKINARDIKLALASGEKPTEIARRLKIARSSVYRLGAGK